MTTDRDDFYIECYLNNFGFTKSKSKDEYQKLVVNEYSNKLKSKDYFNFLIKKKKSKILGKKVSTNPNKIEITNPNKIEINKLSPEEEKYKFIRENIEQEIKLNKPNVSIESIKEKLPLEEGQLPLQKSIESIKTGGDPPQYIYLKPKEDEIKDFTLSRFCFAINSYLHKKIKDYKNAVETTSYDFYETNFFPGYPSCYMNEYGRLPYIIQGNVRGLIEEVEIKVTYYDNFFEHYAKRTINGEVEFHDGATIKTKKKVLRVQNFDYFPGTNDTFNNQPFLSTTVNDKVSPTFIRPGTSYIYVFEFDDNVPYVSFDNKPYSSHFPREKEVMFPRGCIITKIQGTTKDDVMDYVPDTITGPGYEFKLIHAKISYQTPKLDFKSKNDSTFYDLLIEVHKDPSKLIDQKNFYIDNNPYIIDYYIPEYEDNVHYFEATRLYEKNIQDVFSDPEFKNVISDFSDFRSQMKKKIKVIFENFSCQNYAELLVDNDNFTFLAHDRSNHGGYNHMRKLSYAFDIFDNFQNDFFKLGYFDFQNNGHLFCLFMACYFPSIGRVDEQETGGYKIHDAFLETVFPHLFSGDEGKIKKNLLKSFKWINSIFSFVSTTFIYITIMKQIVPEQYYEIVDMCGFCLYLYFFENTNHINHLYEVCKNHLNGRLTKSTNIDFINTILFLNAFIWTPHHWEHHRGNFSGGVNSPISVNLFRFLKNVDVGEEDSFVTTDIMLYQKQANDIYHYVRELNIEFQKKLKILFKKSICKMFLSMLTWLIDKYPTPDFDDVISVEQYRTFLKSIDSDVHFAKKKDEGGMSRYSIHSNTLDSQPNDIDFDKFWEGLTENRIFKFENYFKTFIDHDILEVYKKRGFTLVGITFEQEIKSSVNSSVTDINEILEDYTNFRNIARPILSIGGYKKKKTT